MRKNLNNTLLRMLVNVVLYVNKKIEKSEKIKKYLIDEKTAQLLNDIIRIVLDLNRMTTNNTTSKILKMKINLHTKSGIIETTVGKAILEGRIDELKDWINSIGDMS